MLVIKKPCVKEIKPSSSFKMFVNAKKACISGNFYNVCTKCTRKVYFAKF